MYCVCYLDACIAWVSFTLKKTLPDSTSTVTITMKLSKILMSNLTVQQ